MLGLLELPCLLKVLGLIEVFGLLELLDLLELLGLRTFVRKLPNIDFFRRLLPLKVDELVMSEM